MKQYKPMLNTQEQPIPLKIFHLICHNKSSW